MNKPISPKLSQPAPTSPRSAANYINIVMGTIKTHCHGREGHHLRLRHLHRLRAQFGAQPQNGAEIRVPARRFRVSAGKGLKESLNA